MYVMQGYNSFLWPFFSIAKAGSSLNVLVYGITEISPWPDYSLPQLYLHDHTHRPGFAKIAYRKPNHCQRSLLTSFDSLIFKCTDYKIQSSRHTFPCRETKLKQCQKSWEFLFSIGTISTFYCLSCPLVYSSKNNTVENSNLMLLVEH